MNRVHHREAREELTLRIVLQLRLDVEGILAFAERFCRVPPTCGSASLELVGADGIEPSTPRV